MPADGDKGWLKASDGSANHLPFVVIESRSYAYQFRIRVNGHESDWVTLAELTDRVLQWGEERPKT